jgi:hypothetical protein
VLAGIVVGSATGGAVVALVLFAMSGYDVARPSAGAGPIMPAFGPALAGGGGVLAGALVAWAVSKPLHNAFRRAAMAMMAVMGTALVAGATLPAHQLAGRAGLAAVAALCLAAMLAAWFLLLRDTS